jgi:hypothetical protein
VLTGALSVVGRLTAFAVAVIAAMTTARSALSGAGG